MTEAEVFAALLVLAVGGWATTNVCMSRSVLQQANALKVLQQIVDREDTKVASLAERVLNRQNRGKQPEPSGRPTDEEAGGAHPLAALFRSPGGSTPVAEQPDSDDDALEIHA